MTGWLVLPLVAARYDQPPPHKIMIEGGENVRSKTFLASRQCSDASYLCDYTSDAAIVLCSCSPACNRLGWLSRQQGNVDHFAADFQGRCRL